MQITCVSTLEHIGGNQPRWRKVLDTNNAGSNQPTPDLGRVPRPHEPLLLEPTPTQKRKGGREGLKHAGFSKAKQ
eukprot:3433082-Amphidinium_carterae.1